MKLILIESVEHLGLPGDVVDVKTGYARNYLLPQKKAYKATEDKVVEFEHKKRIAENRRKKLITDLQVRCETLSGAEIEFTERVTDGGVLYGSITARRITDALSEKFGPIEGGWVKLAEPIKEPGTHDVEVKLAPELVARIQVNVIAEGVVETEAATEAQVSEPAEGAAEAAADEAAPETTETDNEAPDA